MTLLRTSSSKTSRTEIQARRASRRPKLKVRSKLAVIAKPSSNVISGPRNSILEYKRFHACVFLVCSTISDHHHHHVVMVKRKSTRIRIVLVVASSQKHRNYTPQQSVRNSYDIQMFHENFFHLTFLWWYNTRFVRKIERYTITTVMWFRSSNDEHRIKF